jgi:hypothetical protein
MIAFLAYCLQVTLKNRTMIHAPGLTTAAVLEKLATIQMVEVWIPTVDGRWLVLSRQHPTGERCAGHAGSSAHLPSPPTTATDQGGTGSLHYITIVDSSGNAYVAEKSEN